MKYYRVVFEHHKRKGYGGQIGTRFLITYIDRADYIQNSPLQVMHDLKIIARGVSLENALDLTALTPEVCTLTRTVHAILTMTGPDQTSKKLIDNEFHVALTNIIMRRKRREENLLTPLSNFPFVDVKGFPKNSVPRIIYEYIIKNTYVTPNGTLDDPENDVADLKAFIITVFNEHGITVS